MGEHSGFLRISQGNEITEPRLTTEELRVVEVLFEDWKELLRRTAHPSGDGAGRRSFFACKQASPSRVCAS